MPNKKLGLTERQRECLAIIREAIDSNGVAPTYQELAAAMRCNKTVAYRFVEALEERGYIRRMKGRYRSILVICDGEEHTGKPAKPLHERPFVPAPAPSREFIAQQLIRNWQEKRVIATEASESLRRDLIAMADAMHRAFSTEAL